jgi:glycerophosphoryl diester phosphodiesterase
MGAPPHPFFAGLSPTLHIAHRGGAALSPENTMEAFRQATERWRTQVLEIDVQPTRDGVLVVAHDLILERCTDGKGELSAHTLAELQQLDAGWGFSPDGGLTHPFRGRGLRIPTLREVLGAFPELRFNIEVKVDRPDIEALFADELRACAAVERAVVGSEHDELAARLVRALPGGCFFYPREALAAFVMAVFNGEPPPVDDRYQVLDMPLEYGGMRLVDERLLAIAGRHDRWVNVWTIDDLEEMKRLVALGVGGIMTDRPDLLREVLDR